MDDRALRLALEALLDEPTLKSAHRASIERGLADLRAQRLTPNERDYLCVLIEHYEQPKPPADPIAALIAAFQHKLPDYDPTAVATAIQHALAQRPAILNGAPVTMRMDGDTHAHQANLMIGNQIVGNVTQTVTVHIPIPDARFDHLMQAAFQRQTNERITNAAQQIESDRLLNLRLQGFVGRVNELATIREHIAAMRPTGGYVLIKALAGEGKSSSIAKLIQEAGIAATPHHFIALTTGREYQLGLLRAVVAQLILKHNLTVSYFPEDSYPAMKGEFARILDKLSKQGIQETIYLDGLDQLQPEIDGSRDLSFLPPQPPPGIVIVLGSRPDETLKPLEILHRVDYDLPPLSEDDALQLWRSVQPDVSDSLLHDLYAALKGNALFVHFAADTMRDQSIDDATSLIRQIEQNPSNLFGITLERIKNRSEHRWPTIWKPMLALLLVAQEPLRLDVLGDLLAHDHDTMQDAVLVLGGLVSQGIDQRVALHHLLFRDYLAASVFNQREVKRWQQQMADWCATDVDAIWDDARDPIEQARRLYARHHYITHLALAENWTTLWQVLDTGDYGEQKTRFDPSTRLYALDLDRGRESAIAAGQSTEEHIQNLPRLWKYSLLRTSLTSRVDQWPDDLFVVLVMLGRTQEALERIELISNPLRKLRLWSNIIHLTDHDRHKILHFMEHLLSELPYNNKDKALAIIAKAAIKLNEVSYAFSKTLLITDIKVRAITFGDIAKIITESGELQNNIIFLEQAISIARSIAISDDRNHTLTRIAISTCYSGDINRAISIAQLITDDGIRNNLLSDIVFYIVYYIEDVELAIKIAQLITDDSKLSMAFGVDLDVITKEKNINNDLNYIEDIARTGDFDRAFAVAQSVNNELERCYYILHIALISAAYGDVEKTIFLIEQSNMFADSNLMIRRNQEIMLIKIAIIYANAGNIDNAATIAYSIEDNYERDKILAEIAIIAAKSNDIDYAFTITRSILDKDKSIENLCVIANIALKLNKKQIAQNIIECAIKGIESYDYSPNRDIIIDFIINYYISIELFDYSLIINQIKYIGNDNIHYIAENIAKAGYIDYACNIIKLNKNNEKSIITLCKISKIAAKLNQYKKCISIIDDLLSEIEYINDKWIKNNILKHISESIIYMGDFDRAHKTIKLITDEKMHNEILCTIAEVNALNGDFNYVYNIVELIDDNEQKVIILCTVAKIAANSGSRRYAIILLDDAIGIIRLIDTPWKHNYVIGIIAQSYAEIGAMTQATAIADSIYSTLSRIYNLNKIIIVYSKSGDIDEVIALISKVMILAISIEDRSNYTSALIDLVRSIIDSTFYIQDTTLLITQAIDITSSIPNESGRIKALTSILRTYTSPMNILKNIHWEWRKSRTNYDTWSCLQLITPLLKFYPWIGTAILEEEAWVNAQLKRLG